MKRSILLTAIAAVVLASGLAEAATEEQKCLSGRAKARGKYESCVASGLAKTYGSEDGFDRDALLKCVDKLDAAWTKLNALDGSTTCGGGSRLVDNGTTFTDRMTGLVWEKKTDDGGSSDYDDGHALNFSTTDDGSAFSIFLENLNSAGLGGAKSWRLPSVTELLTLANQVPPGFNQTSRHWTTTGDPRDASKNLTVRFDDFGGLLLDPTERTGALYVRAVRGG